MFCRFPSAFSEWDYGYEEEQNTWEPEWNLLGCDDLVREYKTT